MQSSSDRVVAMIERLRKELPPVFAATQLGDRTGGALHWPSVQNLRSRGEVPKDAFVYSGRRVLVITDLLLNWWQTTLSDECQSPVPPSRRAVREDQEATAARPRGRQQRRRVQRAPVEMETADD